MVAMEIAAGLTMDQLKALLPDIPRWVEARDLVLSGEGEVFGLETSGPLSLVLRNPDEDVTFVIGRPDPSAVMAAVGTGDLIAGVEARDWLASSPARLDLRTSARLHIETRPPAAADIRGEDCVPRRDHRVSR